MVNIGKLYKNTKYIGVFFLVAISLGACMSLPNVKGPFAMFSPKKTATPIKVAKSEPAPNIYIVETTGMPPGWSDRLHTHLTHEAHRKAVPVTKTPGSTKDLKLVGHFSAAETSKGTLVAYVWDVQDEKGENLHRISGQKTLPHKGPRGAWSALSDETLRSVGEEAALNLQNWLIARGYNLSQSQLAENSEAEKSQPEKNEEEKISIVTRSNQPISIPRVKEPSKKPEPTVKVASLEAAPLPAPKKETGFKKVKRVEKQKQLALKNKKEEPDQTARQKQTLRKTKTTPTKPVSTSFVYVSAVNGAKGHGNSELTRAIISSLAKNGLGISPRPVPAGYKLEGKVKIEPSDDGKDRVFLNWNIKTADGTLIGTVSQKNKIKAGTFDQTWGQTAYLAADAAAGSIKTVIDKRQKLKI